jgi:DNA-binding GntR family transcriptional regulator
MRASGSEVGRAIVGTIHAHGARRGLDEPAPTTSLERTASEHRAILDALVARDTELAASRITAHINSAWSERRHGFDLARGGVTRSRPNADRPQGAGTKTKSTRGA